MTMNGLILLVTNERSVSNLAVIQKRRHRKIPYFRPPSPYVTRQIVTNFLLDQGP